MKPWKRNLLVASGVLLGAGVLCTGIGLASGGSLHYSISIPSGYQNEDEIALEERTITDLGTFSSIAIAADSGDISIRTTTQEAPYLESSLPEGRLEYGVRDGVLTISWEEATSVLSVSRMGFSLFSSEGQGDYLVTLYLPENYPLDSLEVENDYGDVALSGVTCDSAAFSLDCGDLAISSLTCHTLEIENDYGDVSLSSAAMGTGEVQLDCGTLAMSGLSVSNALEARNDYGDIVLTTAEGVDHYSISAETEYGTLVCTGLGGEHETIATHVVGAPTLSLHADCGDIVIK